MFQIDVQGGRKVTIPQPIRYHNLIWITYVHLVTCPVDPYVHTNIRLSLTQTVCPCAVSYAPTQSVPVLSLTHPHSLETCAAVAASIELSPLKSTRKRSSELGVPRSTMQDHMKKDLNERPYRPTFVNELLDGDMDRRYESCRAMLDTFSNAVSCSKVLFSDECAIYRSARDRNVVFWSKENPNFTQELEYNQPHVIIWAGMTSDYLIGPYFFDGSVNAASYSAMLEMWLIPQLRDRGLLDDVWLQHDGTPAHFALSVRDVLNEHFPGCWIGRGSPTSPSPLPWNPCSPDLTTPDNSLWGIIKARVAACRYNNNNEDLRRAVEDAFRTITPKMLRHVTEDVGAHQFLCPASRCTYGSTGHVTKYT